MGKNGERKKTEGDGVKWKPFIKLVVAEFRNEAPTKMSAARFKEEGRDNRGHVLCLL